MLIVKGRRGTGLLTFSPDGRTLAARYDGGLQLWRGLSEPEFRAIPTSPIGWMAFSPDNKTLYLDGGGMSGELRLMTHRYRRFGIGGERTIYTGEPEWRTRPARSARRSAPGV
jgi:WD40 repeat protein